jgi:hypothetical protein
MPKSPIAGLPIAAPKNWALSTLLLHFEGEDLKKEDRPFASTAMVQLRLDMASGVSDEEIAARDLAQFKGTLPGFEFVNGGHLKLGSRSARFLEFSYDESLGRRLQQLVLYLSGPGGRWYMVSGTHVSGTRFDRVRPDIVALGQSISEGL